MIVYLLVLDILVIEITLNVKIEIFTLLLVAVRVEYLEVFVYIESWPIVFILGLYFYFYSSLKNFKQVLEALCRLSRNLAFLDERMALDYCS
jgi:hypothetical protein